jgi:hypothetical protein
MSSNGSPQDLNEVALANLRDFVAADDKLLPEWRTTLAALLKDTVPRDLSALEKLVAVEQRNDSAEET